MSTIRVIHIITGLDRGGAETMLSKLLIAMDPDAVENEVVSLTSIGPIGNELLSHGFKVTALNLPASGLSPKKLYRLWRHLRERKPRVVQTWMYHSDLLGGVVAKLAGVPALAWNIRHSDLNHPSYPRRLRLVAKLCALTSRFLPNAIVCCADAAKDSHIKMGYQEARMQVIPNGFDTSAFFPHPSLRNQTRATLGVFETTPLIGLIGRMHPQKGHNEFIEAARIVSNEHSEARFLLCGSGADECNKVLIRSLKKQDLLRRFLLLGERSDMTEIQRSLTVACSASAVSEGFSNAIGEAMASGVPCVVTNVGGSAKLVDDTGWVVVAQNPNALARAILDAINLDSANYLARANAARARIVDRYGIDNVSKVYQNLYLELRDATTLSNGSSDP